MKENHLFIYGEVTSIQSLSLESLKKNVLFSKTDLFRFKKHLLD